MKGCAGGIDDMGKGDDIKARIEALEARKAELEASIPAHSTKPLHIMQIEEIEDQIELLEDQLKDID